MLQARKQKTLAGTKQAASNCRHLRRCSFTLCLLREREKDLRDLRGCLKKLICINSLLKLSLKWLNIEWAHVYLLHSSWSLLALVVYPQPHHWTLDSKSGCRRSTLQRRMLELSTVHVAMDQKIDLQKGRQSSQKTGEQLTLQAQVGSRPFQTCPSSCGKSAPDPQVLNKSPEKSLRDLEGTKVSMKASPKKP